MNRTRYVLIALAIVALAASTSATLAAQQASIRGTVTDSTNQAPIQGAQVSIVGTSLRTETNASGQYRISGLSPGTVAARVQLIGYGPAQISVALSAGKEAIVDFSLAPGVAQLEEIVSVGYGTETRGELASAISSVKAEDLAGQPIASVDAALQGKAPGVQVVQNAGNPGKAPSVRIRGAASVSASNDPLFSTDRCATCSPLPTTPATRRT